MAITLHRIDNFQEMEVQVSGPGTVNRMFIYTGVALFFFEGTGSGWLKDSIEFELGRVFTPGQVRDGDVAAIGFLSSISNKEVSNNAGWAVDFVNAQWDRTEHRIKLNADLAVRDSDGRIQRMGFQVTVLARI